MRTPLTAIILTKDEELNIADCLASLDWVDDVVVVDSGSRDATVGKARAARPDLRVYEHPFVDFGDQRNWALEHTEARHAWVLFLDADERSTPAFAEAVSAAIAEPGNHVGFFVAARNHFQGRWLKHAALYPSYQLRLLKRGRVRFRKEGHGQREVADGPLATLAEPYDHFPFSKGLEAWRQRHAVYARNEIELLERLRREPLHPAVLFGTDPVERRRGLKRLAARAGFRPYLKFLYLFFWRRGFLDGRAGLAYIRLRMEHDRNMERLAAERRKGAA